MNKPWDALMRQMRQIEARIYSGQSVGGKISVSLAFPSGRVFKYEASDYAMSCPITPETALTQAVRIFRENYKPGKWAESYSEIEKLTITRIMERLLERAPIAELLT